MEAKFLDYYTSVQKHSDSDGTQNGCSMLLLLPQRQKGLTTNSITGRETLKRSDKNFDWILFIEKAVWKIYIWIRKDDWKKFWDRDRIFWWSEFRFMAYSSLIQSDPSFDSSQLKKLYSSFLIGWRAICPFLLILHLGVFFSGSKSQRGSSTYIALCPLGLALCKSRLFKSILLQYIHIEAVRVLSIR